MEMDWLKVREKARAFGIISMKMVVGLQKLIGVEHFRYTLGGQPVGRM